MLLLATIAEVEQAVTFILEVDERHYLASFPGPKIVVNQIKRRAWGPG
jgi:hypothetical protein